jgi:hypothetical protein
MEKISFEQAKEWLRLNYPDERICEMFDEEVSSGNWIDAAQYEEEGYDSEHDYYIDFGHGEAEAVIITEVFKDLESLYELDFNRYVDETDLYQFMREEYSCLYNA